MVQSRGGLALVLTGALLLSAVWLVACWVYVRDFVGLENLGYLQPLELATGITALVTPLIVVWMIALFIARAGSLRRETRGLLGRLEGLTYADQAATERVGEITQALKAQTELLAAATDASVGRVETLRQALAEETRRLGALVEASGAEAGASQARLAELLRLAARQQGQAAAEGAAAEPLLRAGGASLERAAADLKAMSQQALAELNRSLEELQAAARRLAENGSASAGRLQAGAEGLLGLGQKIDDAGKAQAASLAQAVVAAEQRLAGFVGGLGQLDGAVKTLLQRLDLDLAARGERLKAQLAAESRLLSDAAESLRRAVEGAGAGLAAQADALARRLQEELGVRAAALTGALEPQMCQLAEVTAAAGAAARAIGETLAGERRALGDTAGEAQGRVQALGEALAARQRELVAAAAAAEAAAAGVAKALQGEARQLATAAQGLARELGAESDGLALAIGRLRAEAEAALGKAAALRRQGQGEARDAFLALASELVAELNRQTLDLHALLGEELPAEVWQRLKAGDGAAVARRLPKLRDRQGALAILKRYEKDPRFQALADRFMAGFERLLAEAGAADPAHGLSAVFLTADVGRLYLVLARATGRSGPGRGT
jgi:hypothetical protein